MYKKKGIAPVWGQLLKIVIGLVVVLVVANILGFKIFENTSKALKDLSQYTRFGQKDFEPYKEELTGEEKLVDKSIRALKFAIEKTANPNLRLEKPDDILYCSELAEQENEAETDNVCCEIARGDIIYYEETSREDCKTTFLGVPKRIVTPTKYACPEMFRFLEGVREVCIHCENEKCEVRGFELPQEDADDKYIDSFADPKYILYYESFPHNEDKSWQVSAFDFAVEWMVISGVFNSIGPFIQGVRAGLKTTLKSGIQAIRNAPSRAFRGLIPKAGQKELLGEGIEETVEKTSRFSRFLSKIKNFIGKGVLTEQQVSVKNLIQDYFYFKLGKDADELLEIVDIDFIIRNAKGKTINQIDEMLQTQLKRQNVRDIFRRRFMDEKGIVRSWNTLKEFDELYKSSIAMGNDFAWLLAEKQILESYEKGIYKTLNEITDRDLRNTLKKEVNDLAQDYAGKSPIELQELAVKRSLNELTESTINKFILDVSEDVDFLLTLTQKQLRMTRARRSLMYNLFKKQGQQIDEKLLKEITDDAIKLIDNIPPGVEKNLKEDLYTSAWAAINKDTGGIDFQKIFGREFSRSQMEKLDKQFLEVLGKKASVLDAIYAKDVQTILRTAGKGAVRNTFGFSPGFKGFVKDQIPLRWGLFRTGGAIVTWPIKHRYIGLVLLTQYAYYLEGKNEKFWPQGINNLVLTQPFYLERKHLYDTSRVEDYLVLLQKENGWFGKPHSQRLYLASPCKADIEVYASRCSCKLENGAHVLTYDYKSNKIYLPIQEGTALNDNPIGHYYFDSLNDAEKMFYTYDCFQQQESFCMNSLLNNYLDYFLRYVFTKLETGDEEYKAFFGTGFFGVDYYDNGNLKEFDDFFSEFVEKYKVEIAENPDEGWAEFNYNALRTDLAKLVIGRPLIADKTRYKELLDQPAENMYDKTYRFFNYNSYDHVVLGSLVGIPKIQLLRGGRIEVRPDAMFEDFFNEGSAVWDIVRKEYYYHVSEFPKDQSSFDQVVKDCISLKSDPDDPYALVKSPQANSPSTVIAPCINIKPTLYTDSDPNFCYEGSKDMQVALRGANMAVWFALDAYVAGQTLGVGVIVFPVTGFLWEALDQAIIRWTGKWPKH